jgi:hypothetical protein
MRFSYFPVVFCLVLAACGGGGGSSSGGGGDAGGDNAPISNTPLVLTSVNYEPVSQAVAGNMNGFFDLSSSSSSLLTGVTLETPPAWMPALLSQVKNIKTWSVGNTAVLSGVEMSVSDACAYGGTANASVNDANNNDKLDAGDSVSFTFANCAISSTERVNGSLSIVVNSFTDGYYSAADISMSLNNFSVVSGNTNASAAGDMRVRFQESSTNTNYSISSNSLRSSTTVSGVTKSTSMTGVSMNLNESKAGNDTLTYAGTLAMSSFGNQLVVLSTASPWLMRNGAAYPYAGQMLITGQAGSKIRITAVSSSNVRLELDATGDGVYEESKVVTWASLQ